MFPRLIDMAKKSSSRKRKREIEKERRREGENEKRRASKVPDGRGSHRQKSVGLLANLSAPSRSTHARHSREKRTTKKDKRRARTLVTRLIIYSFLFLGTTDLSRRPVGRACCRRRDEKAWRTRNS